MGDGLIVVVPILSVVIGSAFITQYRLGQIHERLREHDKKFDRIFRKIGRNGR